MMYIIIFLSQALNPSLSLGLSIPDNYTDDNFGYFYQLEFENSFTKKIIAPGIFFDYFYKKEHIYSDPYFINSGLPVTLNAGGGGFHLELSLVQNISFDFNLGYFVGEFSGPVLSDSGRVFKNKDWRKSLGAIIAFNLFENIGRIRTGIRIYVNLIPFGAEKPPYDGSFYPYYPYYYSLDYASLNCVGFGLLIGLNRQEEKR